MIYKVYFYIVISVVFMISCSTSQFGWEGEAQAEKDEDKYIEDFDPLTLEEDFEISDDKDVESDKTEEKKIDIVDTNKEVTTRTEEVTMQGYRVQLLATRHEDLARKAKQKVIYKIQENVYLEFASPLWKIRVGDCRTLKEAEELREKVKRIGRREGESEWINAWIVRSKIKVERKIEN